MNSRAFEEIEGILASRGGEAGFAFLVEKFRGEKNYPLLFEARLMRKRHELGLPLIQTDTMDDLPAPDRAVYEQATIEAAREVGGLFLADGNIERAWPYFRAIGETAPIAAAIETVEPEEGRSDLDAVIGIAFHERVHLRKGFELLLHHQGICRAITCFGQYPPVESREESGLLLVRALYAEIVEGLKRTIAQQESEAPATSRIPELIEGRAWLFEGGRSYSDSSHVSSVVQQSIHLKSRETLRLALELTAYGMQLAEIYQFRGEPPFENIYQDHSVYLKALLGEDVAEAVAHFEGKVAEADPDRDGTAAAEVLVTLLCRLERYPEALEAFRKYLAEADPTYLRCPSMLQLCQLAGDFDALKRTSQERGDLLSFAAAALQDAKTRS
jgi:tetratricopeptide (TPR) repeat protein